MRQLTVAALVAFALGAYAQEGEQMRPRVDVPGERAVERKLDVSEKLMDQWELVGDDRDDVKKKVADLNTDRAKLIEQLDDAQKKVKAEQRKLEGVLAQLRKQEEELHQYIERRLPESKKADFKLRVRLQPLINWLKLTEAQANDLVAARQEVVRDFGGEDLGAKIAAMATEELDSGKRKEYIELVKNYRKFNEQWMSKVKGLLNEEQKKMWEMRFRRTEYSLTPGGGP